MKWRNKLKTKFKCVVCGKLTAGKIPFNFDRTNERGDGTFRYPRKHKLKNGKICPGTYQEAEWVDVVLK